MALAGAALLASGVAAAMRPGMPSQYPEVLSPGLPGLGRVGGPAAADLCRCVAAELRRAGVQRLRPAAPKAGQLAAGGRCAAGVSVAAHLAVPVCARVALPYALHAAGAERCRRTAAGCGADQNFSCAGSALRATLYAAGTGAFLLCTGLELPQTLFEAARGMLTLPDLLTGIGIGLFGLCGLVCVRGKRAEETE